MANTSDEICNLKENVMKRMILVFSIALLSLASVVYANTTASSLQGLDETSGYYYTAQFGGVFGPNDVLAVNYIDVSNRYANYKSWAAIRFDLGTIRNTFNSQFGIGNWQVQKVVLSLWDSDPSFAVPGQVEVRFTDDDTIPITKADRSPLVMYEPELDPINGQFTTDTHDSNGTTVEWISYNAEPGFPEIQYALFDTNGTNSQGAQYIAAHIRSSKKLTLAFLDDGSVEAGWVGYGSAYTMEHPMLTVTAVAAAHEAICINPSPMDFNGDCKVDFQDFAIFADQWLNCGFADPNDCK